jgi:CRISPR type III-A-associated RAMP protein Csm4
MLYVFPMTPRGSVCNNSTSSLDFPFLRSDTLFKAMLHIHKLLWGKKEWEEFIQKYSNTSPNQIPFFISSIFPVVKDIYFLPKPVSMNFSGDKKIPNIAWISASLYEDWLQGKALTYAQECFFYPSVHCHKKDCETLQNLLPDKIFWECQKRTRNKIHPSQTSHFVSQEVFFAENVNWYVLIECQPEYKEKVEAIFRLLAEEGMGENHRSFLYHPPIPLPETLNFITLPIEKGFLTLSLYHPSLDHVKNGLLQKAQFQLIERQGWYTTESGEKRKQPMIRMLTEGSHFCLKKPEAKVLLPFSESYHYIYPFCIAAPSL